MARPRLIVTAGLPGSGKSTLAKGLVQALQIPVLSIDPIEAAMWRADIPKEMTGIAAYQMAEAIAEENLKLGLSVIVDAVNPVEAARTMWVQLAERTDATLTFVECHCSDHAIHRERIENRRRNISGMAEISWERVEERCNEYEPWLHDRISLDTAHNTTEQLVQRVLEAFQQTQQ
jgi:predicted kinase